MPGASPLTPPAEEPDEALMLRYAAGDIAAFDVLYARHALGVWRYLLRSVRVAALADDLLQDVWFSLARQGGAMQDTPGTAYQPSARFRTWLFTIAHNRLVDHFRSVKNHVRLDDEGSDGHDRLADSLAADSGFGPVRQLQSRQQAAALIEAVEQLPGEQREAFLLQAEGGLRVEEIASATGVSFETAKSRLRYARNSLRQQLEEFA